MIFSTDHHYIVGVILVVNLISMSLLKYFTSWWNLPLPHWLRFL